MAATVSDVAIAVVGVGFAVAAVSLDVRRRRAGGESRRQLRWLLISATPFPDVVPAAVDEDWNSTSRRCRSSSARWRRSGWPLLLVDAVDRVASGGTVLDPDVVRHPMGQARRTPKT